MKKCTKRIIAIFIAIILVVSGSLSAGAASVTNGVVKGSNVVDEEQSFTTTLSSGEVTAVKIVNSILTINVDAASYVFQIGNITKTTDACVINEKDGLLHILTLGGVYYVFDLYTGVQIIAYRNSSNGKYCSSKNSYAYMVYGKSLINNSYFYEILTSNSLIRELLMTRFEFDSIVNGGDPSIDKVDPSQATDIPTEAPTQEPTDFSTQGPTEVPTQKPTDASTQKPTEIPTQKPTDASTQGPTEVPTQKPTDFSTQEPTEVPTQKPTDASTQKPTEIPTQKPTDFSTQEPTEVPTYKPTDASTQETTQVPTQESTSNSSSCTNNMCASAPKLTLNKAKLTVYIGGKSKKITLKNANGSVSWVRSNKNASLTPYGTKNKYCMIKGLKVGKLTVTAKCKGKTYKLLVIVKKIHARVITSGKRIKLYTKKNKLHGWLVFNPKTGKMNYNGFKVKNVKTCGFIQGSWNVIYITKSGKVYKLPKKTTSIKHKKRIKCKEQAIALNRNTYGFVKYVKLKCGGIKNVSGK